jgi:hypothetical protein
MWSDRRFIAQAALIAVMLGAIDFGLYVALRHMLR